VGGPLPATSGTLTIPDPHICYGERFHVFRRSDAKFIIYDSIAPFGNRTVEVCRTEAEARKAAEYLARKAVG
jgi:hypothetical protein